MRLVSIFPGLVLAAFGVLLTAGSLLVARLRHAQQAALRMRLSAEEAEQAAMRRLRLAAHDLRGIGMSLHGHAGHLAAAGHPDASGIGAAATDLLDLADDLQDHAIHADTTRVLREETVALTAALDDAIAAVQASLSPGQRHWRIGVELHQVLLLIDPRALRHVLTRVLADAVRSTREQDWIDIALQRDRHGLAVVIADEGAGTAMPEASWRGMAGTPDSRGLGLRLVLARALMQAHGGQLEVEALRGVGTRVSLHFPASRVRSVIGEPVWAPRPVHDLLVR
ncbi:MAG: sensor histidine kinase [Rhodospirillales bacterium]|nr:sensor histidine kinase [Rhodospirillales bacterium]MDE2576931.1 sensor histidine kinase [Rhodospirillales bacterium]